MTSAMHHYLCDLERLFCFICKAKVLRSLFKYQKPTKEPPKSFFLLYFMKHNCGFLKYHAIVDHPHQTLAV